ERYRNRVTVTPEGGYALRLESGHLAFYTFADDYNDDYVIGTSHVTPNVWHHVAGVYSGGTLSVYIDGQRDGPPKAVLHTPGPGTTPLKIGASGDSEFSFSGWIDDVRISAAALYTGNGYTIPSHPLGAQSGVTKGLWRF